MTFEVQKKYQARDGRVEARFLAYTSTGQPVFELIFSTRSTVGMRQSDGRLFLGRDDGYDIVPAVEKTSNFFNVYSLNSKFDARYFQSEYFKDSLEEARKASMTSSLGVIEYQFENDRLVGVKLHSVRGD